LTRSGLKVMLGFRKGRSHEGFRAVKCLDQTPLQQRLGCSYMRVARGWERDPSQDVVPGLPVATWAVSL
jgi:hypothetical protein